MIWFQRWNFHLCHARSTAFTLFIFLISVACCRAQGPVPFTEVMATQTQITELQHGGFILYLRHGQTDTSRPDRLPKVDFNDCTTQRPLNEDGRRTSTMIGRALRKNRIPIGEILVSPYCRALDTATLAFGKDYTVDAGLAYSSNLTTEEKAPLLKVLRHLLTTPVPLGSNRVIVAHAPNLADLIGYFIAPEGTVAIFRPGREGEPEYVASIPPQRWQTLKD